MIGDNLKKKYGLIKNIIYCHKKLKEYRGGKYFILVPLFVLTSVAVPLSIAVLPSVVIKILLSKFDIFKMISIVMVVISIVCILQFLLKRLEIVAINETFLFRVSIAKEFTAKSISIPYEDVESPKGKESFQKAIAAIYSGNEVGIEAMIMLVAKLGVGVLGLIVYALITASLHPVLMVILIICPVARLFVLNINRKWKENHKKDWIPIEVKIRYLQKECLDLKHGKDIRMYQIEGWFVKSFNKLIGKRLSWNRKEIIRKFNSQSVERIVSLIRDICCYGYLIYGVYRGMDIAEFTLYLGIISGFSSWVEKIFNSYGELLDNNMIINDYRSYMEQKDYWEIGGDKELPREKTHTITLEDIWYTYPGTEEPVFEGLNLTIKKGEKLAVVGMNGSGKSTLIKIICGLYKPQKGRVLLDGIDIKEFNLKEYYSLYSVVFQEVFAFAFPIIDNIICSTSESYNEKKLSECIDVAGLKDKIDSLPNGICSNMLKDLEDDGINLSGGEMQKLMLARALYKESSIVILDEPTAALDPIAEFEMYQKYNSFIKGKTSIFISHRLSSTVFCDRIIFLKAGKIIEDGSHEELIRLKGEYANMYELQAYYYQEEVEADVC